MSRAALLFVVLTVVPSAASAQDDEPVDMDFVDPLENEAPPPMDTSYVAEQARRAEAERVAALDPELFGASEDTPRPPTRFSPVTARLGARAMHRGLSLLGYERGTLSDYLLPVGAAAAFSVEAYPGALFFDDALAHLGVRFDLTHSILVESSGANDNAYPTTAADWQLGLRYRAPLDEHGSDIGAELSVGQQGFVVERGHLGEPAPEGAPNVRYTGFRIGGSGRFYTGDVFVGVRAAYLPALDTGPIAAQLGGASAHGAELGASLEWPLELGFSLYAELDARVWVISATPNEASPSSAAGAVDRFIGLNLGAQWRMPSLAQL